MNVCPDQLIVNVVISNWKLWTTKKGQHHFGITGNVVCVPIHAFTLHSNTRGVFSEVLHKVWRIFPWSFDTVVTSDVPTRYLIFCTKTRKRSLFLSTTSGTARDLYWMTSFSRPQWRVFVRKRWKVCCSILQWSDVGAAIWCRTCTVRFFRSLLRISSSFPPILVCEMKVLWKVASFRAEDLKPVFLYLAEYSVKNFITTRQYLVNLMCNCWFRMCTQFHQKLVSYKCMLFVECLVVLQEYFVNRARATKFQFFFLKYFSSWKLCQTSCLPHNCCCNVT